MKHLLPLACTFAVLLSFHSHTASAADGLICDRQKVQQAIRVARNSPEVLAYSKQKPQKPQTPVSARLQKIFRDLEMKTFGIRFMTIESTSVWHGLTISENQIKYSTQTAQARKGRLKNPDVGAAFEIAHEMAHLVQTVAGSPHGITPAPWTTDMTEPNRLHAETDCIATEIIYQAGYPLTEDIVNTLTLIKEECLKEPGAEFCEESDRVRKAAVSGYIMVIAVEAKSYESIANEIGGFLNPDLSAPQRN